MKRQVSFVCVRMQPSPEPEGQEARGKGGIFYEVFPN